MKNLGTEEEKEFYNKEEFNAWFSVTKPVCIGHNLISFDLPVLNRLWDSDIDLSLHICTLTLSYLYNPALEGGHSLDAWGQRLGFPKQDFSDWSQLSDTMVEYCKNDVRLTHKLYKALTEKMLRLGYSEMSAEIEHKIAIIIKDQIEAGCYFHVERARDFSRYLGKLKHDLSESIQGLFPPKRVLIKECRIRRTKEGRPHAQLEKDIQRYHSVIINEDQDTYECYDLVSFNIASPKQRVQRLLDLGWTPVSFTPTGLPKVDEDALVAFSEASGEPGVKALAEWLVVTARLSTIAGNPETGTLGWIGNTSSDSRIHGKVFSCGASSRRMTHNTPNTANVPSAKKAKYGKECRSFWGVEPDKGLCLIGYDAKGLETECFKHWLNNPAANKILDGDIHTDNAKTLSTLIGRDIDREWGAKTSWYAWMFGCYPPKIAQILKCDLKYAEEIWEDVYPNRIPGLKRFIESIQYEWKSNKGRLVCIDGGYVVCPSISSALNYKIQPTGAVVMKLSSILIKEESARQGIWNRKVLDVHDEGQHEGLDKEIYKNGELLRHPFGDLAVECIRESGRQLKFNVPLDGSYSVGYNWSQTH